MCHLLEVISDSKFIFLICDFSFHFRVSVVDDGQEHVEQYEEHKEHVQDEVDGPKDSVSCLQLMEIEISQNDTEQSETEIVKIFNDYALKESEYFKIHA